VTSCLAALSPTNSENSHGEEGFDYFSCMLDPLHTFENENDSPMFLGLTDHNFDFELNFTDDVAADDNLNAPHPFVSV
jgi:hypothetical protein